MDKIQEIFTAPWAIADNDYYRLLSLLVPCVAAGNLDAIEKRLNNNKITAYATTPYLANRWELDDDTLPVDSVAVIILEGTLYSWETYRLEKQLRDVFDNPKICGAVLWINGGPQKMCVAVRQPDGEIFTEVSPIRTHPWQKWPFVRGIFNFIDSLVSGYKCLMKSAEVSMGEDADLEETKFDKWVAEKFGDKGTNFIMAVAAVLGGVLALVLFMVVPTALAGLLARFVPLGGWRVD